MNDSLGSVISSAYNTQSLEVDTRVIETARDLEPRNLIFGDPPTAPDEKAIWRNHLPNPDSVRLSDEAMTDIVRREIAAASAEVVEVASESDDEDEPAEPSISRADALSLCEQPEWAVKAYGELGGDHLRGIRHKYD